MWCEKKPDISKGDKDLMSSLSMGLTSSLIAEVDHVAYNVCQIKEPVTIKEVFAGEHGKQWKAAADLEFEH